MNLDQTAIDVLLMTLECPEPILSAAALKALPTAARSLVSEAILVPDGYEMVFTDEHTDQPIEVITDEAGTGYGYFSSTAGWITINSQDLLLYRVNVPKALQALLPLDTKLPPASTQPLSEGVLWRAGVIKQDQSSLELWFGRRLFDPEILTKVRLRAVQEAPFYPLTVLTSTPSRTLTERKCGEATIVSISDVLALDGRIDPSLLLTQLSWEPEPQSQIWLAPDASRLVIGGTMEVTFRSARHRKLIRLLVEARRRGERRPARELLEEAGCEATTLRNAFGARLWAQLAPYLRSSAGLWGFEV